MVVVRVAVELVVEVRQHLHHHRRHHRRHPRRLHLHQAVEAGQWVVVAVVSHG